MQASPLRTAGAHALALALVSSCCKVLAASDECAAGLTTLDGTCYRIVNTQFIRNFTSETPEECCSTCASEEGCSHFEWDKTPGRNPSTCFLITGEPKIKDTVTTCVSGAPTPPPVPAPVPAPPGAKNVLYVIFDDLRPNLENYGQGFMHTPHFSAFSQTPGTVTFTQAHVQSAMCVPTRASFLTGRRPQTTLVMNAGIGNDNFRVTGPTWTTMPQHFRQQGWFTTGVGKVFHKAPNDDQLLSWSEPWYKPKPIPCDNTSHVWCAVNDASAEYEDELSLAEAQSRLRRVVAMDQPFFMAVGFHKPHTPYRAPQAFFDIYPEAKEIAEPKYPEFPTEDLSGLSWFSCQAEDQQYPINHTANYGKWVQRLLRRAYYASVSFADDLFGRLLATLDELGVSENTAVVVHGDHGYQLGEFNIYCKETNFNRATNVPLMLRAPWRLASGAPAGGRTTSLVELVDLFPTLAELVGAPPLDTTLMSEPELEGKSFVPVLDAAAAGPGVDAGAFNYSFSQYSRHRCLEDLFEQKAKYCPSGTYDWFTGFSVRAPQWRYTRWVTVETTAGVPNWGDMRSEELYYYDDPSVTDFDEWDVENLAYQSNYAWALEDMREQLRKGFSRSIHGNEQVIV